MMATVVLPAPVEDYLVWLAVEKGRATNTLSAYRRDLERYVGYVEGRGSRVDHVNTDMVVDFVRHLDDLELAAASRTRTMVSVRGLHRFMLAEGLAATDPSADAEIPRTGRGLPKPLTEPEIERLLDGIEGDAPLARRDRAMVELLYGTGIRISELVGTSLGDLDLDAGLLRVFGKGSKERIVPVGRLATVAMVQWLAPAGRAHLEPERWASRDDSEAIFLNHRGGRLSRQGAWGALKKHGSVVGLGTKLSPHVLRHSCATHMLDHGADVRSVQELLGHASITTTQVYTSVSTERLKQVYRAAHPRAGTD
ncbi:MAG: site-specific tyrosine recombinase [Acidimicrobiales bacterium]